MVGPVGPGGMPQLALADNSQVYVLSLHAGMSAVDLRRAGFGYSTGYSDDPSGNDPGSIGPSVSADAQGDLVVAFYVYRRQAYRTFVLFPHASQLPIDAHRLVGQGFEVVGTDW